MSSVKEGGLVIITESYILNTAAFILETIRLTFNFGLGVAMGNEIASRSG